MERPNSIYISYEVRKALILLAHSKRQGLGHISGYTADELADNILRDHLVDKYPQLFEHQKKVEAMEKELLKTL